MIIGFFALAIFSGCLKYKEPEFTCNYNECAYVAPAAEIQAVQDYLDAQGITAIKHCSGLFYTIDDPGTGASPTVCNTIAFTYVGSLTNGTVFEQATSPVVSNLSGLITGFKNGLPRLKTGGRMHLYIPPSLGYGSTDMGKIPPNSIVIFDVSLAGFQ